MPKVLSSEYGEEDNVECSRTPIVEVFIFSSLPLQVLQFGRIENGSFILDFQAPFSPLQAFAVALANLC